MLTAVCRQESLLCLQLLPIPGPKSYGGPKAPGNQAVARTLFYSLDNTSGRPGSGRLPSSSQLLSNNDSVYAEAARNLHSSS